jgi:HlyD family secretion protein
MAKRKKKRWRKIVIVLVIIGVVVGLVAANMAKKQEPTLKVDAAKVRKGKIVETIPGTGRVQPEVQVNISANVSGEITGLFVEEGDRVKRGNLLVTLDRKRYEASAEQAQSTLKSAQAALSKSQSELRRARELFEQGLSSEADLEAAEADFQYRTAEVERSQAYLKEARDNLAKTSLYSPMDGVVSWLGKELGEMALGAQFQQDVIMIVADLRKMEVVVEVDESDIINVTLLDTADIKIDAYPDTTFVGVVREIAHTATTRGMGTAEEITNFDVKITLLDVPERLRPGMSATADIITEVVADALHIPIQCVVLKTPLPPEEEEEGESGEALAQADVEEDSDSEEPEEKPEPIECVFAITEGVANQIPVITGISSDTDIEILSGLEEGSQIVSGPFRLLTHQLKDGDEVEVKGEGEGKKKPQGRGSEQSADAEMMDEM